MTDLALDVKEMALRIAQKKMERALAILADPHAPAEMLRWAGDVIEPAAIATAVQVLDRGHGKAAPPPPGQSNAFSGLTEDEIADYVVREGAGVVEGIAAKRKKRGE